MQQRPSGESLSIVIPCFNARETIVETVASAVHQQDVAVQVIVVDDGSTDDSVQLLQAAALERLTVVCQPNQGVSAARNMGLGLATGDFVCCLDSDDILEPRFGVEMIGLLRSRNGQFGYSNYRYFADVPERPTLNIRYPQVEGFVPGEILFQNFIPTPGAVVVTRAALNGLRFDTGRQGTEDWLMWMQLCMRESVHFHSQCLIHIRVRGNSLGRQKAAMVRDMAGLFEQAEALVAADQGKLSRRHRARFYYRVASAMVDAGRTVDGFRRWARAAALGLGPASHAKFLGRALLRTAGVDRLVERALWNRRTR